MKKIEKSRTPQIAEDFKKLVNRIPGTELGENDRWCFDIHFGSQQVSVSRLSLDGDVMKSTYLPYRIANKFRHWLNALFEEPRTYANKEEKRNGTI